MESLGISTDDVWSLFLLIDADDNGVIDLDEFVSGCMQLHGPAKSLQVTWRIKEERLGRDWVTRAFLGQVFWDQILVYSSYISYAFLKLISFGPTFSKAPGRPSLRVENHDLPWQKSHFHSPIKLDE